MHGVVIDGERLIAAPARRLACAPPVSVKPQTKKTTDDHTPCEATKPSSFHAAQRLRSTMRCTATLGSRFRRLCFGLFMGFLSAHNIARLSARRG
jgi:hypothetical protein